MNPVNLKHLAIYREVRKVRPMWALEHRGKITKTTRDPGKAWNLWQEARLIGGTLHYFWASVQHGVGAVSFPTEPLEREGK